MTIQTMEYDLAMKNNKLLPHTGWMLTAQFCENKTRPKRIDNITPFIENPRICEKMFSDRKTTSGC